jgi:hypothetical protein
MTVLSVRLDGYHDIFIFLVSLEKGSSVKLIGQQPVACRHRSVCTHTIVLLWQQTVNKKLTHELQHVTRACGWTIPTALNFC